MLIPLLYLLVYVGVTLFFVHQMRYTNYEHKDYSAESWIDAGITVLALEGVISLLRFIFNFPLYKLTVLTALTSIDLFGEQVFQIGSAILILAVTLLVEGWVCKVRYPGLTWTRILTYLFIPKVLVFAFNLIFSNFACY